MFSTLTHRISSVIKRIAEEFLSLRRIIDTKLSPDNSTIVGSTPTLYTNTREPVRFGYYNTATLNKPTNFGNIVTFSSKGHFRKENGNWINQLVFDTGGRVFHNRSVNGGEFGSWIEFVTSASSSANVRGAGAFIGNNVTNRGVTGVGYWKRWCKITSTASPRKYQTGTYNHPFAARTKIVSVSVRVDGTTNSTSEGFQVAITDTAFLVTNKNIDAQYESKPITFYVEYEP